MWRSNGVIATAMTAVLVLSGTSPLQSQESNRRPMVAVMYFSNGAMGAAQAELAPLGRGIADLLVSEMSANPALRSVERGQIQRLLKEQGIAAGDRVPHAPAVRIGHILGADYMIIGGFVTDGRGVMRIDVRVVNVETSRIDHVESVRGRQDDVMSLVSELSLRLQRAIRVPDLPRPVREARTEQARRVPFAATMLYSHALAARDSGNESQAKLLLAESLEHFPDYEAAKLELAKLSLEKRSAR